MVGVTKVSVLLEGYSYKDAEGNYHASGTVSLISTPNGKHILVDTGGCFDRDKLENALVFQQKIPTTKISHIICTHAHSDHIGNLNLFPSANQIVEREINDHDVYSGSILLASNKYELIPGEVEIWSTPGHSTLDVTVMVLNGTMEKEGWSGCIAIVGDLFECENDNDLWQNSSHNISLQEENRRLVQQNAAVIIPGHGKPFKL